MSIPLTDPSTVQIIVCLAAGHARHAVRCEDNLAHERGIGKVGIRGGVVFAVVDGGQPRGGGGQLTKQI